MNPLSGPPLVFSLDGEEVVAADGETLLEVADRYGVEIPRLCHQPGMRPDGNCRSCVVEIEGERALAPSCCRRAKAGMRVRSGDGRARRAQKMILELLLADVAPRAYIHDSELAFWARRLGVESSRFPGRETPPPDLSHPAMAVNLDACIHCKRCVRACREEQANDVIGYAGRGAGSKIVFDFDDPMGASTCVACGECVQACPTGALAPAREAALEKPDRAVASLCPYCGVGCQLTFHIKDEKIRYVEGRDGPANHSRLCVKGRYGFDYVDHPHRLRKPLIRKDGIGKDPRRLVDPENWRDVFREASWDEALDRAGGALAAIRDARGGRALAAFGSAKGGNEEAYLFQKLARAGFGANNVDHCTRLCHASSVAALLEGLGSGAVSNQVADVARAETVFVIGANPGVNHPVAATWIKNAARRGTNLIVADPRENSLMRFATIAIRHKPASDVALLNAMLHTIIEEGLVAEDFVRNRTRGFEDLRANVAAFAPEKMAAVCGVEAETIRRAARMFARARGAMILWGMGISQHIHGTDNARCLIALSLAAGQIGREGAGLHPLRGQNNVQGASDAGLIPMMFPDYRRVDDDAARAYFENLWGAKLDPKPGLTVVEIMDAIVAAEIRGMYIMGENPAMSDPDAAHAREALAALDMLAVQDIFLTETAALADVVFPASAFAEKTGTFTNTDRMVQLGRRALDPPGEARQDLWIIQQMAKRLGLEWNYPGADSGVAAVFDEMRRAMPSVGGVTWERLQAEHSVTYPCRRERDPGEPVVFRDRFPTADGLGAIFPARLSPPAEIPDEEYPFVLITGRELEHWHTGAMTRRARALDALEPAATASLHPSDMARLGVAAGDAVTVATRRGKISLAARADRATPTGAIFIPFCYYEAAVNLLTNPKLDPFGKIPEFKYCAARVTAGGEPEKYLSFGGGVLQAQTAE